MMSKPAHVAQTTRSNQLRMCKQNKMAKPIINVVVTDPADVDLTAFSFWLRGFNLTGATKERLRHEPAVTKLFSDYPSLVLSETEEMYRVFNSVEPYLHSPPTFLNQSIFQVCCFNLMLIK